MSSSFAAPIDSTATTAQRGNLWQWAAFGTIVLASCGHLLIKFGLSSAADAGSSIGLVSRIMHYLMQPAVVAGLGIYGAGTALWIYAVSQRNISFLYPLTALNYVIVTLGGWYLFQETVHPGRWLGIAVVVLGVALLQVSAKGEQA